MTTMAYQITSLPIVYSTVYSDAYQRKHQSSVSLAFVWGIHPDRWISHTKGQLRGKCFHLMTSSWIRNSRHFDWHRFVGFAICLVKWQTNRLSVGTQYTCSASLRRTSISKATLILLDTSAEWNAVSPSSLSSSKDTPASISSLMMRL